MKPSPRRQDNDQLRQILNDLSRARLELHDSLDALLDQLADDDGPTAELMVSRPESERILESLQAANQQLAQRLQSFEAESDRQKREAQSLRDKMAAVARRNLSEVYRAINREDPLSKLKKMTRERRDLSRQLRALQEQNSDLSMNVERLQGLADRYQEELSVSRARSEDTGVQTRRTVLRELIMQVAPRRVAELLEVVSVQSDHLEPGHESTKASVRLLNYLRNCGVEVMHRKGEQIVIKEEDLEAFVLDEPFRQGAMCEVVTPGFLLDGQVLVRTKVRYIEEVEDGPGETEQAGTHQPLSRCPEETGTRGEAA